MGRVVEKGLWEGDGFGVCAVILGFPFADNLLSEIFSCMNAQNIFESTDYVLSLDPSFPVSRVSSPVQDEAEAPLALEGDGIRRQHEAAFEAARLENARHRRCAVEFLSIDPLPYTLLFRMCMDPGMVLFEGHQ